MEDTEYKKRMMKDLDATVVPDYHAVLIQAGVTDLDEFRKLEGLLVDLATKAYTTGYERYRLGTTR